MQAEVIVPAMNWDDLRVVQAVYQAGSYAAAGNRLNINETTVARRLSRLEETLNVTLFEAINGARKPTAQCENIVAHVEMMQSHLNHIASISESEIGIISRRIATTDSVAATVLAPKAPAFLAAHPELAISFLASTENVNFSQWEADLAIRFRKPEKGNFIIAKLAEVGLYLIEPAETGIDRSKLVCAYPDDLDFTPESQHLLAAGLKPYARCVTKNIIVMKELVRTGQCGAILPSHVCMDMVNDTAFRVTKLPQSRGAWLFVQPHLKNDPPTRMVIDWVKECFAELE